MREKAGTVRGGKRLPAVLSILFWLLVWQLLAMWVDNEILLATPLQTMKALCSLVGRLMFWQTVGLSLVRIALGFVLGVLSALLLAVAAKRFVLLEELLAPVMSLCRTVPMAVFVVLLLIWWGSSFLAVAISYLMVLPNIYISTLEGIRNTDRELLEMAEVFDLPVKTTFFYIYRPALKPFLHSSLKLALGMCWKSGVAAEVIGTPAFSIGEQLYMSKIHLDTANVFAWAVVVLLLSVGFERLVLWLAAFFWQWEPECRVKAGRVQEQQTTAGAQGEAKLCIPKGKEDMQLCVRALSKSYGNQEVLQIREQTYESGSCHYLTTPSGSGKTTYLRILCGLEKPDSGSICAERDGREVTFCCSMQFQEDRLCEEYSALKNVEMITGSRVRAQNALLKLLDGEALEKPCSQLSGGMKRRVALVRAMESSSDCVLLDEPFTGMDAGTRTVAEKYIRERQNGRILIIATHI